MAETSTPVAPQVATEVDLVVPEVYFVIPAMDLVVAPVDLMVAPVDLVVAPVDLVPAAPDDSLGSHDVTSPLSPIMDYTLGGFSDAENDTACDGTFDETATRSHIDSPNTTDVDIFGE